MATSKRIEQPAPRTEIGLVLTAAAAGAAIWFQYPVAVIVFFGLMVSAMLSLPPILTGTKDPKTQIEGPGNPGERAALSRHRMWKRLPAKLFMPGTMWPIPMWAVGAAGVGLICFALPYEGALQPLAEIDASDFAPALPYLNALSGALLTGGIAAAMRGREPENGEAPSVTVPVIVTELQAGRGFATLATGVVIGGAGAAVAWWWIEAADWYLIQPAWTVGLGAFLVCIATAAHWAFVGAVRTPWRHTLEARETWAARWASMPKLKEHPQLISHRRLGVHGEAWIDIFAAPVSQGAAVWTSRPIPDGVEPTLPPNTLVAFLGAPDVGSDGQPIIPSRSAVQFKVITWNGEHQPNLLDPALDRELLAAWLELKIAGACLQSFGANWDVIMLEPPAAVHVEKPEYEPFETAAWEISYGVAARTTLNLQGSMEDIANAARGALGPEIEVLSKDTHLVIGAVRSDTTTLQDRGLIDELEAEEERARWAKRWVDITGQGLQAPSYFPEHDQEARLADGKVIHSRLFMAPMGLGSSDYFAKATPERLQSGLPGAQWSNVSYFTDRYSKKRFPNSLHLFWSEQQVSLNPARISPKGDPDAVKWALTGAINAGFLASKMPRPEVLQVKPLTSRDSRSHVWEITLMLYGGITLADVRKNQERIQGALEGCEWLLVADSPRGCRILAGAQPTSRRSVVAWASPEDEHNAMAVQWQQVFVSAGVKNSQEQVPKLVEVTTLEKNELVKQLRFSLPPGIGLADITEQKKRQRIAAASKNEWIDIRPGGAGEMVMMASEQSPMPSLALFDWEEVTAARGIPFATNILGEPLVFDPLVDAHLVVMGGTGSGKSAMLQSLLAPGAVQGYELHLFDKPKGAADFQFLVPYATQVATEYVTIAAGLERIYREVERRKALNQQYGASRIRNLPEEVRPRHMLVMIDEFTSTIKPELLEKLSDDATEDQLREHEIKLRTNQYKARIGAAVGKIMREARSAGVTMLIAGQTLNAEEMKQSPALGNIKNQAAMILLGKASFGQRASAFKNVELAPELGEVVPKGRGIFEGSEGAPSMFQAWYGANFADYATGEEAEAAHLRSMSEMIARVREPEPVQAFDEDLRPEEAEIRTFGEVIGAIAPEAEEVVVDLGEIDIELDLSSFEQAHLTDITQEAAQDDGTAEPSVQTLIAGDGSHPSDVEPSGAPGSAPTELFETPIYHRPTLEDDLFG